MVGFIRCAHLITIKEVLSIQGLLRLHFGFLLTSFYNTFENRILFTHPSRIVL